MDYTVGSVADLVSGKNTPNKPKVIKKKLPQPKINSDQGLQIEKAVGKVKKTEIKPQDSPYNKGNKAPFKKGNKPPFNKKNKSKQVAEKPFGKVAFKKGKKPPKKNKKHIKSPNTESNVTVIDHKVIKKLKKQEVKDEAESDVETDIKSEDEGSSIENDKPDVKTDIKSEDEGSSVGNDKPEDLDNKENPALRKEHDSRTIFVGNIGTTVTKSQLLKLFGKFGKVEAVRLRCATPSNPGVSKRVAVIKKMFHPKRATMHSYIRFQNREDALKALKLNGTKYKEHHLRVQICDDLEKPDTSKAIFVGNLPFDVEDDDLWATFESLGTIKSVRVIRNAATGMGIGIGYVNFDSSDSVEFALQMEEVTVKNKVIRIQRCKENSKKARKVRRHDRRKYVDSPDGKENPKLKNKQSVSKLIREKNKSKNKSETGNATKEEGMEKPKRKDNKITSVNIKNGVFQGSKSEKKKQKPKVNKGFIQKLKLSQKIAPRVTL